MNMDKYPRAKKFMDEHPGWTIDMAIAWIDKELEKDE